jgi:hypothetical protein
MFGIGQAVPIPPSFPRMHTVRSLQLNGCIPQPGRLAPGPPAAVSGLPDSVGRPARALAARPKHRPDRHCAPGALRVPA